MKTRIELYTDTLARNWADRVSYAQGEVKYHSRADERAGYDLTPATRGTDPVIKLRVRDNNDVVSIGTYEAVREACLSAALFFNLPPEAIFLHGPARGIDLQRLRGEVALDLSMGKPTTMKREGRNAA